MYMLTSFINNQVDGLRKYCYDSIGGYVVCSGINYYWLKLFKKIIHPSKTLMCQRDGLIWGYTSLVRELKSHGCLSMNLQQ